MILNDVVKEVELSKRAVKYYEEQGLLKVKKDENGYRNYSPENVRALKEISAYRKLGIGISDIRLLLEHKDMEILKKVYEEKRRGVLEGQQELLALQRFLTDGDVEKLSLSVDYQSVGNALLNMAPGYFGYYLLHHFLPYLDEPVTTREQKKAYEAILRYLDSTKLRIPLFLRAFWYLFYRNQPAEVLKAQSEAMDKQIKRYLSASQEELQALKEKAQKQAKRHKNPLVKYNPFSLSQRTLMKRLKDAGYYDILIPNMKTLSPKYKEYQEALDALDKSISKQLGLYYDSGYNPVLKK